MSVIASRQYICRFVGIRQPRNTVHIVTAYVNGHLLTYVIIYVMVEEQNSQWRHTVIHSLMATAVWLTAGG